MKEDAYTAVIAAHTVRAMRPPRIRSAPAEAATTNAIPLDAQTRHATQDLAAFSALHTLRKWKGLEALHSLPTVFIVGGIEAAVPDEIHSRVQQYVDRCSIRVVGHPADRIYYGGPAESYPARCLLWLDSTAEFGEAGGVFAAENTARLVADSWRQAPVAFDSVEFVEERDVRGRRLFAELENGAAHGRATVERLRELEELAHEEGEPFSLDALEALLMFANEHPTMPVPELTLAGSGGIVAEWRRPSLNVTLYFASPISVQYVVKRRNPWYRRLPERASGATTVDRVGEVLRAFLASEWPIRV